MEELNSGYSDIVSSAADYVVTKDANSAAVNAALLVHNATVDTGLGLLKQAPYYTEGLSGAGTAVLAGPGIIIDWAAQVGQEGALQGTVSSLASSAIGIGAAIGTGCLLYTSPSPRD